MWADVGARNVVLVDIAVIPAEDRDKLVQVQPMAVADVRRAAMAVQIAALPLEVAKRRYRGHLELGLAFRHLAIFYDPMHRFKTPVRIRHPKGFAFVDSPAMAADVMRGWPKIGKRYMAAYPVVIAAIEDASRVDEAREAFSDAAGEAGVLR